MKLSEFADLMERVVETSSTKEKKSHFEQAIKTHDAETVEILSRLALGERFDDPSRNTHVSTGTVKSVVCEMTGTDEGKYEHLKDSLGKHSQAVEEIFGDTYSYQDTLGVFTISNLYDYIDKLPEADGTKRRKAIVRRMFDACWTPKEAKWVSYSLLTDLSIGASWKTFAGGFANAENLSKDDIYKSKRIVGTLPAVIAEYYMNESLVLTPTLGEPFKPMLASGGSPPDNYEHDSWVAQTKYDGARLLIHNTEDDVKLFSRNQKDVTDSLPEIAQVFEHDSREMLLDTEVVGYDPEGNVLPFNQIMRRFRREKNIEEIQDEVQARAFVFDCLNMDGNWLIDVPFNKRHEKIPNDILVHEEMQLAELHKDVEKAYEDALNQGHEGVIVKKDYHTYEFSRSSKWQKIKPTETLDLRVKDFEYGSGENAGKLGALVVETKEGVEMGNVGGGFTDKDRETIKPDEIQGEIIEVMAEELSDTDKGYALRFPRFIDIRDTKNEADELQKVKEVLDFEN